MNYNRNYNICFSIFVGETINNRPVCWWPGGPLTGDMENDATTAWERTQTATHLWLVMMVNYDRCGECWLIHSILTSHHHLQIILDPLGVCTIVYCLHLWNFIGLFQIAIHIKCFISYLVELNTSITLSCFIFIVGRSTAQWPSSSQGSQCQWGGERHEPIIISVEWNSQQSTVPRLCAGICCFIGEPDTQVILKCGQLWYFISVSSIKLHLLWISNPIGKMLVCPCIRFLGSVSPTGMNHPLLTGY